jgi:hypothetical protein
MSERSFKKLLLKSQLLDLEEEESRELDQLYAQEFSRDFERELRLKIEVSKKIETQDRKYEAPPSALKKLHRKLAMATHPDVAEDGLPFREVQSAYEGGDAGKLLSIAGDLGVEVSLTKKEMLGLAKQLRVKRERIDAIKKTVRWVWCTSEKSDKLRAEIRRLLGVTDEAWSAYLGKSGKDDPRGEKDET